MNIQSSFRSIVDCGLLMQSQAGRAALVRGIKVLMLVFGAALLNPAVAIPQSSLFTQQPIPDEIWNGMQGRSWHPALGCPGRQGLALLTVAYRDFEGQPKTGPLIVATGVAREVLQIFKEIYQNGSFRIERIELVDRHNGDDDASDGREQYQRIQLPQDRRQERSFIPRARYRD